MKPWSDTVTFSRPLRDVRLRAASAADEAARAAVEEEVRASYERGRRDAEQAMSEQLFQQRNELHQLMSGVLDSLRKCPDQVIHDTESTLVTLALSVAQKLVAGFPIAPGMVEAAVRDALSQVEGTAQFTVRLHPEDLALLQTSESPLLSGDGVREFRFLASPDVTRGGCMVQTQFGTVDARRETKFDLLQRSLTA